MEDYPIKITGFNHYAITVGDLNRSLSFYREILGLKEVERPTFDFNGVWLDCGNGIQIHLIEGSKNNHFTGGTRALHFAFSTSDIYKFREKLVQNNIVLVKDIKSRPDGVLQMFIQDPDGYFIEITQI